MSLAKDITEYSSLIVSAEATLLALICVRIGMVEPPNDGIHTTECSRARTCSAFSRERSAAGTEARERDIHQTAAPHPTRTDGVNGTTVASINLPLQCNTLVTVMKVQ